MLKCHKKVNFWKNYYNSNKNINDKKIEKIKEKHKNGHQHDNMLNRSIRLKKYQVGE
jgi:hypothetical protein